MSNSVGIHNIITLDMHVIWYGLNIIYSSFTILLLAILVLIYSELFIYFIGLRRRST